MPNWGTMPRSVSSRAVLASLLVATGALVLGAPAAEAKYQRGGLPVIGQISFDQNTAGRVQITVPVTYTRATSGPPRGLESSRVFLRIAAKLDRGRPTGIYYESSRDHRIGRDGTKVDRFTLNGARSRWLLAKSRKQRGKLVRVDVRHLIKARPGERPLHEKDASLMLASSQEARAQGVSGILTLRNETGEPIKNLATPVVCMYSRGEFGSSPEAFSHEGEAILPGGTIEAEIEADGDIVSEAEFEGESSPFGIDALGIAAEVIGNAVEAELGPIAGLIDIATHCESMPSIFLFVAASADGGSVASSEAWVLTGQDCNLGCPHQRLISAYEALSYQNPGVENGSQIWATAGTGILEAFVGHYNPAATRKGEIVQNRGLKFEWGEPGKDEWVVKVGKTSEPFGFSG